MPVTFPDNSSNEEELNYNHMLQTSLLRALAPTTPTYVFPAMNTLMYEHPLTAEHLRIVQDVVGYKVVGPIGKNLACGDVGKPLQRLHCVPIAWIYF
jgi:phosphopantothenoylcysteine synthetase/decarboxylase